MIHVYVNLLLTVSTFCKTRDDVSNETRSSIFVYFMFYCIKSCLHNECLIHSSAFLLNCHFVETLTPGRGLKIKQKKRYHVVVIKMCLLFSRTVQ